MSYDLRNALVDMFRGVARGHYTYGYYKEFSNKIEFMEIPIPEEGDFNLPLMANDYFSRYIVNDRNIHVDKIICPIRHTGYCAAFKSLEPNIKEALLSSLHSQGLQKIMVKDSVYYGTQGALFASDFKPLVLFVNKINKSVNINETGSIVYKCKYPVMYISPDCFLLKNDTLNRFITGKLLSTVLDLPQRKYSLLGMNGIPLEPRIRIEKIPFVIKSVDKPSVKVTNEDLINTVLDNLNDFE